MIEQKKLDALKRRILDCLIPFQEELDKKISDVKEKFSDITDRDICCALVKNQNPTIYAQPWAQALRTIRENALVSLGKQLSDMIEKGLFDGIVREDEAAKAKEKGGNLQSDLLAPRRVPLIDIPDSMATGISLWNFPMTPAQKLPVHDHTLPTLSIVYDGLIKEKIFTASDTQPPKLKLKTEELRARGNVTCLYPSRDNIHTLINTSPDQEASTFHLSFFSPTNPHLSIQSPVDQIYEMPKEHSLRSIGPWEISETELGTWVGRRNRPLLMPDVSGGLGI